MLPTHINCCKLPRARASSSADDFSVAAPVLEEVKKGIRRAICKKLPSISRRQKDPSQGKTGSLGHKTGHFAVTAVKPSTKLTAISTFCGLLPQNKKTPSREKIFSLSQFDSPRNQPRFPLYRSPSLRGGGNCAKAAKRRNELRFLPVEGLKRWIRRLCCWFGLPPHILDKGTPVNPIWISGTQSRGSYFCVLQSEIAELPKGCMF